MFPTSNNSQVHNGEKIANYHTPPKIVMQSLELELCALLYTKTCPIILFLINGPFPYTQQSPFITFSIKQSCRKQLVQLTSHKGDCNYFQYYVCTQALPMDVRVKTRYLSMTVSHITIVICYFNIFSNTNKLYPLIFTRKNKTPNLMCHFTNNSYWFFIVATHCSSNQSRCPACRSNGGSPIFNLFFIIKFRCM